MDALQRITIATLIATGGAVVAPGVLQTAEQKFPVKPIRLVVAFTSGGNSEIFHSGFMPAACAIFL